MKLIDEYRDNELLVRLRERIHRQARGIGRGVTLMEVCGTHTYAIGRYGIRRILPENVRLISGPGCPVCVTSASDVGRALDMAGKKGVLFTTFGDMLKVPGPGGESLQKLRAKGADVRVVGSTIEAMRIATDNPGSEVVFMGIGFETTTPTVASMIKTCARLGVKNMSLYSVHKLVPPAIEALLADSELKVDGFLCPGHVSAIIGTRPYEMIPRKKKAAVIAGFEPVDILEGVSMILEQIITGEFTVENQYGRAVKPHGNTKAVELMEEVFMPAPSQWRGLGVIPESGLVLRPEYSSFDAIERFDVPYREYEQEEGCMCGHILRGVASPEECPLFKTSCTPHDPVGPCMVSREGTCAAHYRFS
ncbi:MAG TPA: hydrogenase formation protein HypD [Deltaproteobacteria bacterium]|nr:hydrogenase formation protein HypD [Deltaproteobacteria bacterium]